MSETQIFVSRSYDAPRARVYRVWTEPDLVALWWGCDGATNLIHEMDVRPEGVWRIDMRFENGTVHSNHGRFKTVVPDELLEYSHVFPRLDDSTRVIAIWHRIVFSDHGAGTRVDMT